ncbi:molybdate transport repressor ModE-like protein [Conyzicola lurida]|uniref:Molybdate transport repressor ModE-like protein n=1 Tax=Conyzicola lurida TaxID=1172621 RepID=A0A841ASE7_9MICO|nr:LysR family transcriptional regulator [Conyzicola lurida]MBB5844339.1 molybdate transport repressor ModE-like protein [Conyzicola lurida]
MIEIKHLRLLQALNVHGSMSAAARELGYSQSAVTQQIQLLERQLETPLLVRTRSGVRLTAAGEVLVRHGASVLASVALAEAEVDAVAGLRSGRVRISCFPSAAATILPRALGSVGRAHPGVSFTLIEAEPPKALELLRSGESDIAVIFEYATDGTVDGPRFPLQPDEVVTGLLDERVRVAMPADHPAAGEPWVTLENLRESRWIAGCPECRGNLLDACERSGFRPDVAFETDDYIALQGLASAGLGVALVTDLMLTAARPDPGLFLKDLAPRSHRVVSAVSTGSLLAVPGVRQTIDALQAAAAEVSALVPQA